MGMPLAVQATGSVRGRSSRMELRRSGIAGSPHHRSIEMNWERIQGNWKQLKGRVQEQWGKLTDDDFDIIDGRREQLSGKIQERYGIAKDAADTQIRDWETSASDDWLGTRDDLRH
jgi:uncharacterized protein YjbJ (UPF0337 family)